MNLVITCEHGGNMIPHEIQPYIFIPPEILHSHQGYDIGALDCSRDLYNYLKQHFNILYLTNNQTRLLIDYNRSIHHPQLFSKYSKTLPKRYIENLLNDYSKFRTNVKTYIEESIKSNITVIHLSIHSFTPIWKGKTRKTEIGILFDPLRIEEQKFASILRSQIPLICHFNLPYRGTSDGHTQSLRNQFIKKYLGIEIEINQKFIEKSHFSIKIKRMIIEGITKAIKIYEASIK